MSVSEERARRDFERVLIATTPLDQRKIDELSDVFAFFDTNGDGHVSVDQARLAFRAAAVLFDNKDLFKKSTLSRQDWLRLCGDYAKDETINLTPKDKWVRMFKVMDTSRRGIVQTENLQSFLKSTGMGVTMKQVSVLAESMNKFGIGESITEEDFVAHMMKREKMTSGGDHKEERGNNSDSTVDVAEAFGF